MTRRPGRAVFALGLPILLFIAFGVARMSAPLAAVGIVFDSEVTFAIVAAALSLAGAVLLFIRPVEVRYAHLVARGSRPPSEEESARLAPALQRLGRRTGIDPERLILFVQDVDRVNASAGAGHLLFVTRGALALPDDELEAVLAHELGHHRGLHPVVGAVVWWLSLPGLALAWVYRLLRRIASLLAARLGILGRVLAVPVLFVLVLWQISVMWLFYVAEALARRARRISEFEADGAAARWGYAETLVAAFRRLAPREQEPTGRVARLMADHPPLPQRIERLEAA
jgi:Zn-dependent protease with chaperone function